MSVPPSPPFIYTQQKNLLTVETFPVGTLGCNTSLVYSPQTLEALVIDPGNDPFYLLGLLKNKGLKVRMLLHTHAHFDHIGGSGQIMAAHQCPLWLHGDDNFLYQALPQQGLLFGMKVGEPVPLDRFLEDDQTFGLAPEGPLAQFLKTLHTPGHTPGSCSFYTEYFDHPLLFSGDTLFNGSIGRTDLPGGDHEQILRSIKSRIYSLPGETFCIPGHGGITRIHQEKKSNPFVRG